jgi:hypothetical protein
MAGYGEDVRRAASTRPLRWCYELAERGSGVRRAFAVARVGRLDLDDRGEDLEARVRPGWFWASVAWLCFILAFWAFIGALVFVPALISREPPQGVLAWILFWALFGLWICYVSRDYLVRETLVFAGGKLTLKRYCLIVTLTESFRAEEVRDLRVAGMGNGTVEFEAGGRTRRLRARLEERDARKLVGELRRRLNG